MSLDRANGATKFFGNSDRFCAVNAAFSDVREFDRCKMIVLSAKFGPIVPAFAHHAFPSTEESATRLSFVDFVVQAEFTRRVQLTPPLRIRIFHERTQPGIFLIATE